MSKIAEIGPKLFGNVGYWDQDRMDNIVLLPPINITRFLLLFSVYSFQQSPITSFITGKRFGSILASNISKVGHFFVDLSLDCYASHGNTKLLYPHHLPSMPCLIPMGLYRGAETFVTLFSFIHSSTQKLKVQFSSFINPWSLHKFG